MSLEGPLEINLLAVDNLRRDNVGNRPRGMRVLDRLPWELGGGRFSWPVPRLHNGYGLRGPADAAVIRVFPAGEEIARCESVRPGWFGEDTGGLRDWPTAAECRAWSVRAAACRGIGNNMPAAEEVAWRIDTHLFTILRGWGNRRARATVAVLRRQLAARFHSARRSLAEAAGEPRRVEAMFQAMAILDHAGWVAIGVAEALWRDDTLGMATRRFALRYPMGFALAVRGENPRLWCEDIRPMLEQGARERDILAVLERECRSVTRSGPGDAGETGFAEASTGRRRQVFGVNRDWVRRYEAAMTGPGVMSRGAFSRNSQRSAMRWARNLLDHPGKRRDGEGPEEAALAGTVIRDFGFSGSDLERACAIFRTDGRRLLRALEDPEEAPKGLERDCARYGVPLRPTPRRVAIAAISEARFVAREMRDARHRIGQIIVETQSPETGDAQRWFNLTAEAEDPATRVWDRLWGRLDGTGGSFRQLADLARRWAWAGDVLSRETAEAEAGRFAAVCWMSPEPILERRAGFSVQPVTDGRALIGAGKNERNCAGGMIADCIAPRHPLHVYRLFWKDGRSTLLGVREREEPDEMGAEPWRQVEHAGYRNRQPTVRERKAADIVVAALNARAFRRPYRPRKARKVRKAAQVAFLEAQQGRSRNPVSVSQAMFRLFPGLADAMTAEGIAVTAVRDRR